MIFNTESFFQQGCNVQVFLLLFSSQAVRNPSCRNFSFFFFKSLVKIRNTDVAGTPVALESSSHVAQQSSSRASATDFTLQTPVDILGLPGLVIVFPHTTNMKRLDHEKLYYGPLWTHLKLHSKHRGFLWDFCRATFNLNVWHLIWNSHSSN